MTSYGRPAAELNYFDLLLEASRMILEATIPAFNAQDFLDMSRELKELAYKLPNDMPGKYGAR